MALTSKADSTFFCMLKRPGVERLRAFFVFIFLAFFCLFLAAFFGRALFVGF